MCGICGIFHIGKETIPDLEKIKEMMGYLHHRGPDSGGYYRDKKVALGHTRLSIIDLETGAQPLSNENETLWIVYNGEIFNYKELRKELLAFGHTFRTQSDTEVIVHAYEQWGKDCLLRFNGQWAFALWDKSKEEVFLSRDQYGICPLYYVQYNSIIFFASEIKALFANREIRRDLDPRGIKEFLTFWNPIAPHTVFNGIYQVPPAHYSVFSSSGIECKASHRPSKRKY
jgi:asparagine synthase (glutamine-hydrolysing)